MSISQSSLDIRLQKLICCIGTLAGEIGDSLFIGGCYTEKLKKLKILTGYLEALECYSISDEEILATGTFLFTKITEEDSVNILVNGITISGIYTIVGASISTNINSLISQINNTQSDYVATLNPTEPPSIILTGKCSNDTITVTLVTSGGTGYTTTGFTGGQCSTNCLTEEQVLKMFETVSRYCDICYPASDYQFTNSLIV